MNEFAPNEAFSCEFTTANPTTGARSNADSMPSAVAVKNGAVDGSFALAVAAVAGQTGVYAVSGTVPVGYASGDRVSVVATATVAGVTGSGPVAAFRVRIENIDGVPTANENADALLSAVAEENGAGGVWTVKGVLRVVFAFLAGERAGGGTSVKTFAVPGGTKTRVTLTTDANGNSVGAHALDDSDA